MRFVEHWEHGSARVPRCVMPWSTPTPRAHWLSRDQALNRPCRLSSRSSSSLRRTSWPDATEVPFEGRAVVTNGAGGYAVRDVEISDPQAGEVLVALGA